MMYQIADIVSRLFYFLKFNLLLPFAMNKGSISFSHLKFERYRFKQNNIIIIIIKHDVFYFTKLTLLAIK